MTFLNDLTTVYLLLDEPLGLVVYWKLYIRRNNKKADSETRRIVIAYSPTEVIKKLLVHYAFSIEQPIN